MAAPKGTAARLIQVAKSQIGYVEGPRENETKYGKFTGYNYQPWCGSFVNWCGDQAGVKLPWTVYTPSGAGWFQKNKRWHPAATAKPRPGDIVYFDFPHDGVDRISHVGIVVKDNGDGTVTTVEGNTSGPAGDQRNGGMVLNKVRGYKKNKRGIEVSVVGFGRPRFLVPSPTAPVVEAVVAAVTPKTVTVANLKPGKANSDVKKLQKALNKVSGRDWPRLKVDGIYGSKTVATVKALQKKLGVDKAHISGIPGSAALKALGLKAK